MVRSLRVFVINGACENGKRKKAHSEKGAFGKSNSEKKMRRKKRGGRGIFRA